MVYAIQIQEVLPILSGEGRRIFGISLADKNRPSDRRVLGQVRLLPPPEIQKREGELQRSITKN